MTGMIPLAWTDLAAVSLLLLVNAGLALLVEVGLARQYMIAAVRMVIQLTLVALVLEMLFRVASPLWTGLLLLVMAAFAGHEVMARQQRRFVGWWGFGLGSTVMTLAAAVVTLPAVAAVLQPEPWYHPRWAVPLFGMILGNAMTGVALGLNTLTTTAARERGVIEARLALGSDRWQAFRPVTRQALRSALMPIINSMAATGVVFLPGMMTGQILAGAEPGEAVRYQLFVMFLIGGATGLGVMGALAGGVWRLSDGRDRLRLDRLASERKW